MERSFARDIPSGRLLIGLVVVSMVFGLFRALVVPFGSNYDEPQHFDAIVTLAGQFRDCLSGGTCKVSAQDLQPGGSGPFQGLIYYVPEAALQLLLPGAASTFDRVVVARLFTLGLNALIIILTYATVLKLFAKRTRIALLAAILAAFVPSLSDMMSGINLDAPAALWGAGLLFILAGLLVDGWSWRRLVALAIVLSTGLILKGTVWPLYLVVAFCFWLKAGRFKVALLLLSLSALVFGLAGAMQTLGWQNAASWYYQHYLFFPGKFLASQSSSFNLLGSHSLKVVPIASNPDPAGEGDLEMVVQFLPQVSLETIRGKTLSYGMWYRAEQGSFVSDAPYCAEPGSHMVRHIQATQTWQFVAGHVQVSQTASSLACFLPPPSRGNTLYYDGLVLAVGQYPLQLLPEYNGIDAASGYWGNQSFINLLQDPSAEQSWPQADEALGFPYLVNQRIVAILDWQRTWPAWLGLLRWMVVNFWASFGGVLPGLTGLEIIPWGLITLLAAMQVANVVLRVHLPYRFGSSIYNSHSLWLLLMTAMTALLIVIYRADIRPWEANVLVWSSMRHSSAGRGAICGLLALGFLAWVPTRFHRYVIAFGLIALFWLNVHIFFQAQYPFQHCALPNATDCINLLFQ